MADLKDFELEDEALDGAAGGYHTYNGKRICDYCGAEFDLCSEAQRHEVHCTENPNREPTYEEKLQINWGRKATGLPPLYDL